MKLRLTNLLLALILTVGFASAQFTTDGIYTIQNGNSKYMTNPGSAGSIITLSASPSSWIIKKNADGVNFNIISEDQTLLAKSDGSKGVMTANTEADRNSTTSGALVTFTDQGSNVYRFESSPGGTLKGWNGNRTGSTQVGMGAGTSGYDWTITRTGDIPSGDLAAPILTVTSNLIIDIGDDITYTTDEDAKVYLVPDGTTGDLAAIQAASVSSVETFASSGTLSTTGLSYGDYQIYAVDASDNLDVSDDVISLVDLSVPPVFAWTFDTDGDTEGWTAGNTASGDVADGALTWTWGANNSPKWTKSGLKLSTQEFVKVLVRLKNPNAVAVSTGTNSARVVTTTNGTSATKFFAFSHSNNDADFHTYIVNVSATPGNYNGTLESVQIQGMRSQDHPEGASLSLSEFRLIRAENTWTGATSSDWNVAGNWSNNVVPTGEEVVIPMVSNQPAISSGLAEVATLDLADGVVVSISGGATLRVLSDLTVAGNGHVEVASGSSLVTYGSVAGTDHVINRSTTFDSNTGKYSAVGSPVAGASTSVLGSLVYSYDESQPLGTGRFVKINSPETMTAGKGYFSAFTGDLAFTGTPNTGVVDVSLTSDDFNLVSNPYPSAISHDALVDANMDITGTIYLWDDGGSDMAQRTDADYITVNAMGTVANGNSRSGDFNGNIGAGQGFFVMASQSGSTLSFNNEMKVTGNNADANYFRKGAERGAIQSVKVALTSEAGVRNESLIGFVSDATVGFDRLYDAYKFDGANGVKLYSLLNDKAMAIQGLPIANEMIIPMGIALTAAGEYTLSLEYVNNLAEGKVVYLEDTELNIMINLTDAKSYTFSSGITEGASRFNLIVSSAAVLSAVDVVNNDLQVTYTRSNLTIVSGNVNVKNANVSILDLSGALLFNKAIKGIEGNASIDFQFDANKVYILKVSTSENTLVSKILFN
ncbi:MAG: T9SS type A sorting domain-containing protein [Cyclobacteriaceae bacterium]